MPEQGSGSPTPTSPQQPAQGPKIIPVQPHTATRSGPGNAITGSGNIITGGTLNASQVSATMANAAHNAVILLLRDELTRARQSLATVEAPTADHEDALEAVDALQAEVAHDAEPDQRGLKRLRFRVKELIGVLTPVAESIGGVAVFEEICQHL